MVLVFMSLICSSVLAQSVDRAAVVEADSTWGNPYVNGVGREPMSATLDIETSETVSLHGIWKFNWVENSCDRPVDYYKVDYDDRGWGTIPLPGIWELNGYGDPLYLNVGYAWRNFFKNDPPHVPVFQNHVGTYRGTVEIPEGWNGDKDVFVHFGSVTSNITLYVNGEYVGYSEDSKLEAVFDITDFKARGQSVRVSGFPLV